MIAKIELERIEPNPWQPRRNFPEASLLELGESIAMEGLQQAIGLRPHPTKKGIFQIIWGERRVRASRLVGLTTIEAKIKKATDLEMKKWAILENRGREDTDPIEDARGTRMLLSAGMSLANIAKSVGKRKSELEEELTLLNLPEELQGEVAKGRLSKKLGIAIGKLPSHQHMEVYKETSGRTFKAQLNYIYAVEMRNRNIVMFTLTAEERKEVISAKKKWESFRKASHTIMEIPPNLLAEAAGDYASVYFMKTMQKSLGSLMDIVSKRLKIKELEGGKKNVES